MKKFLLGLVALVLSAHLAFADTTPYPNKNMPGSTTGFGRVYSGNGVFPQDSGLNWLYAPLSVDTNGQFWCANCGGGGTDIKVDQGLPGTLPWLVAPFISSTITSPLDGPWARAGNTTAYTGNVAAPQLVANSVTAGSVVERSFSIGTSGGYATIPSIRVSTNITTGWNFVNLVLTLWSTAPTFTNGDGGAWAPNVTGGKTYLAQYIVTLLQFGDSAQGVAYPLSSVSDPVVHPDAGALIYYDIQIQSAATPTSAQQFSVIPFIKN